MERVFLRFFYLSVLFLAPFFSQAQTQEEANRYWNLAQGAEQKSNFRQALDYYTKCKSSTKDIHFKEDCDKKIKLLKDQIEIPFLTVPNTVNIGYSGGYEKIIINSNPIKWTAEVISGNVQEIKRDGNQLLIVTLPNNSKLEKKISVIKVTAGSMSKNINVIQEPAPEVLHSSSEEISPSNKGELYQIEITSNYEQWTVESSSKWLTAEKSGNLLNIKVNPNTETASRKASIRIQGKERSLDIHINQRSGDEKIAFSQNSLYFPVEGDAQTIAVHTNADNWYIGNSPDWCRVEKIAKDSIRIMTYRNTSDNITREASININTELQSQSIRVFQDAKPYVPEYVFSKILKGRNISFGIHTGYLMPLVQTSSTGTFTGSIINYSLGNEIENASYSDQSGFCVGAIADFRLYKNLYFKTGLDYTYIKYSNLFNGKVTRHLTPTLYDVAIGDFQNSFKEKYAFSFMEIPLLASYRFVLSDESNIQMDAGPVLSLAINSKMKLSGNSDSEEIYNHIIQDNQIGAVYGNPFAQHIRYNGEMNLYENRFFYTNTYSTGMSSDIDSEVQTAANPFNRLNMGVRIGIIYELAGFQLGVAYTYMLTNMANEKFWNSDRIPIFNQRSDVLMSGYRHGLGSLQFKIGYVFRY